MPLVVPGLVVPGEKLRHDVADFVDHLQVSGGEMVLELAHHVVLRVEGHLERHPGNATKDENNGVTRKVLTRKVLIRKVLQSESPKSPLTTFDLT